MLTTEKKIMEPILEKRCSRCGEIKNYCEFHKNRNLKDGIKLWCKLCTKKYANDWYHANKDMVLIKQKAYYDANKDVRKAAVIAYRATNKDKKKASDRAYYNANRKRIHLSNKAYAAANRDRLNVAKKAWQANRRKADPKFKLNCNTTRAIHRSLNNSSKNGRHWESLVGYTLDGLKNHLEKQFQPGMTWDNYGKWHIDHIIPISAFNFETPEHVDFKRCWALKNLRPLWATDNIKKSNKLTRHFQPSLAI